MKEENLINEMAEIIRQLVYYSQISTVTGVRAADMDSHETAWRKGQKLLWSDNFNSRDGKYKFNKSFTP